MRSEKQLITVFHERSQQSKELAKGFMPDNQRLCDLTGEPSNPENKPIALAVIGLFCSAPKLSKKMKTEVRIEHKAQFEPLLVHHYERKLNRKV